MYARSIAVGCAVWTTLALTSCGDDVVTPARDTSETGTTSVGVPPPGTVDVLPTTTQDTQIAPDVTKAGVPPTGGGGVPEEPGPIETTASTTAGGGSEPQAPPPPAEGSGVVGVVTLGPQCAVVAAGEACPDRPAAGARVMVYRRSAGMPVERPTPDGPVITSTTADNDGRFTIELEPGDYVLSAKAADAMSCEPTSANVSSDGYVAVQVPCDTGIR
jgi:hypothetical protein